MCLPKMAQDAKEPHINEDINYLAEFYSFDTNVMKARFWDLKFALRQTWRLKIY